MFECAECCCVHQSDFDDDGFLTALDLGSMIDILFGGDPDFMLLGIYTVAAVVVAVSGHTWFQKTRKGFADVL